MNGRYVVPALLGLLTAALPAWAHHSVVAQYDTSKSIAIEGEVRALELGSPHSYLTVEVKQPHGNPLVWRAELPSAGFLHRAGWNDQSLQASERVQLTGSPSRFSGTELYATSVIKGNGTRLALLPLDGPSSTAK